MLDRLTSPSLRVSRPSLSLDRALFPIRGIKLPYTPPFPLQFTLSITKRGVKPPCVIRIAGALIYPLAVLGTETQRRFAKLVLLILSLTPLRVKPPFALRPALMFSLAFALLRI
jgi:hypothetical protein